MSGVDDVVRFVRNRIGHTLLSEGLKVVGQSVVLQVSVAVILHDDDQSARRRAYTTKLWVATYP
jgi:hypothetical protein